VRGLGLEIRAGLEHGEGPRGRERDPLC
jgi:hypothetical protein